MCSNSVVNLHQVAQTVAVVDYVRLRAADKSRKSGGYRSFEHLFFFLSYWRDLTLKKKPQGESGILFWVCYCPTVKAAFCSGSAAAGVGVLPLGLLKP